MGVAFSFLISSLFLEEDGKQRISRPCQSSVVQNIPQYALRRRLDWKKGRCGRYRANISILLLQGIEGRVVGHSARSEFSTQKGAQATGIVIFSTLVLQQYFCNSRTGSCKRTFQHRYIRGLVFEKRTESNNRKFLIILDCIDRSKELEK